VTGDQISVPGFTEIDRSRILDNLNRKPAAAKIFGREMSKRSGEATQLTTMNAGLEGDTSRFNSTNDSAGFRINKKSFGETKSLNPRLGTDRRN